MSTILIVDDDPGIRDLLSTLIGTLGHEVLVAPGADSAVALLEANAIDVAFCDIIMPGHDGFWLVDQIRARWPTTAVVLATGVQEIDPRVSLRPGVVGYITKPFEAEAVASMIQRGVDFRCRPDLSRPGVDVNAVLDALSGDSTAV